MVTQETCINNEPGCFDPRIVDSQYGAHGWERWREAQFQEFLATSPEADRAGSGWEDCPDWP